MAVYLKNRDVTAVVENLISYYFQQPAAISWNPEQACLCVWNTTYPFIISNPDTVSQFCYVGNSLHKSMDWNEVL